MLRHNIEEPAGCWVKPTDIFYITPEDIHGHGFRVLEDVRLMAYENRGGCLADLETLTPHSFMSRLTL